MPQISIYVPDDLRDALRLHPQINVSRVCQAALYEVLAKTALDADLRARLALAEPSGWPPEGSST